MSLIKKFIFILFGCFLCANISLSEENSKISSRMESVVISHTPELWLLGRKPEIIDFVNKANQKKVSFSDIKKIDKEWMEGGQKEFKKMLMNNSISNLFKKVKNKKKLLISEIFLCDKNGAVIALHPLTTDYWQGDEDKFIESYNEGKGRVFFGPLSYDKSTKTNSVQVSIPVGRWNQTYGVMVVGLKNIE